MAAPEARLAADEWDVDAWGALVTAAGATAFSAAQPVYERVVAKFPPAGRFWRVFAEHAARDSPADPAPALAIFERAVAAAPTSIELWRSYVAFCLGLAVRAPGSKLETDAFAVYERAVAVAGLDVVAHPMWSDYIDFLKRHATLSDSQRRDALRRVYQRAVRVPMQNLESFWREYTTFEQNNNSNKELARGLIAEHQPKNIDARTEFRARRARREGLAVTALPVPPRGRAKESSQAQQWRRFIDHERSNPFSLPREDLHGRVVHAFESALSPLYRYPDIWIEYIAYVYNTVQDTPESAAASGGAPGTTSSKSAAVANASAAASAATSALEPVVERAIQALPACVALHTHISWVWIRVGEPQKAVAVLDALCKRNPSPLAYVHLMRTTRKIDGRDVARKVFGRARKDPKGADPAVYVAAALMEFSINKDSKVARNVFEFGLKNYAKSAVMAKEFVEWLWGCGDLEYMRVVFEKVMPDVEGPPQTVRALWERWIELEEVLGDAASVDRVEAMWRESGVGKAGGIVGDVVRRCRFLSFEGMREEELAVVDGLGPAGVQGVLPGQIAMPGVKRDPRTGRRVGAVGGGGGATNGGGGRGGAQTGNVSLKDKQDGASHRNNSSSSGSNVVASPFQTAANLLRRMSASMPPINGPPPDPDLLFRIIMETPDAFSATPAGSGGTGGPGPGANASGSGSLGTRQRDETQTVGKKRKGDELVAPTGPLASAGGGLGAAPPPQDVFRTRQAAKQSRMR